MTQDEITRLAMMQNTYMQQVAYDNPYSQALIPSSGGLSAYQNTVTYDPIEIRRKKAIEWLGKRWVLHPANRIQKLKEPLSMERTMEPKVLKAK